MLNEEVDCPNGAAGCGGDDIYCVVTDENWSDDPDDDDNENVGVSVVVDEDGTNTANHLGLLILEGEDSHVGRDSNDSMDDDDGEGHDDGEANEGGSGQGNGSMSLSIPATLFLPSEVRSMVASGVTNEQDGNKGGGTRVAPVQADRSGPSNATRAPLVVIAMIFVSALSLGSWRIHVWKTEALRLRDELQRKNFLLPLTLSLLKEREALLERQGQLEGAIERALRMNSNTPKYEDMLVPDQSDDDKFFSIKTCYVEATMSLGQCSKEWQKWWYKTANGSDTTFEDAQNGDMFVGDLNSDGIVSRFDRALSKLINGCESCSDDVTSKVSLWNW
jgi:hypothetical protein